LLLLTEEAAVDLDFLPLVTVLPDALCDVLRDDEPAVTSAIVSNY